MDTIFAQATAPGKAGVSIIRISGPQALQGCEPICGPIPEPRHAALRTIRKRDGTVIDQGLVLRFAEKGSFTGEPVIELHVHGSIAVLQSLLAELSETEGFRAAEAGEFTRRALDNDQLDLTQVEGLADLIDSETELQRQQAMSVMTGELSNKVESWRRPLIEAAALIEATLDFSDEDVPQDLLPEVVERLEGLLEDLRLELSKGAVAERVRDGFEVAIMGPPNVGKSTLLNSLARRPVALTSELAGTTRDILEVRIDLDGLPITLLDTAGLRETDDRLELAGIELAKQRSAGADLRVWLSDGSEPAPQDCDIVLAAKDDKGMLGGISGLTGQGVDGLLTQLKSTLIAQVPQSRLLVRARHRDAIRLGVSGLEAGLAHVNHGSGLEVVAVELRQAADALAEIVGGVDVEDLLDDIFTSFCIGK